jgi:hypothetical protein
MANKTVNSRMGPLLKLYDLHTDYFLKAIDGISDKDANNRLNTKANHAAWLAGSLVQQRFEMCNELSGSKEKQAADDLFKEFKGIQDGVTYPSLTSFAEDWKKISPKFRKICEELTDEKLDSNFEMPGMTFPWYDMMTFMMYREANCIGQLALWRRLLDYAPIKYD